MLRKYPKNLIRIDIHKARNIEQNIYILREKKKKSGRKYRLGIYIQSQLFDSICFELFRTKISFILEVLNQCYTLQIRPCEIIYQK